MKKKIVFVITDYGSFNNFIGEVAVELSRLGNDVYLISSLQKVINIDDKFDYKVEGIKFFPVELPRGFNPIKHYKASKRINKIIDSINPDVVSIHFTTGIFTTTFNGKLKYKTVGTFHGLGFPVVNGNLKKLIYKFVEKQSLERIDEAWVLNNYDLEIIKKEFPKINVNKIPTKGVGCDLKVFNSDNFDGKFRSYFREQLNINEIDFVIAFTGRFVNFKGFDKVIRAFKILNEQEDVNHLKLILMGGEDKAHDHGLTEEEQDWIKTNSNIINVGFTNEVAKYLKISDLLVFPSEKEGMPVCIIESLAMGIPVVTANARGCNDLITDNYNGILLKNNTPTEIARSIKLLMNNKELYEKFRANILNDRDELDRSNFVAQQVEYFRTF